MAVPRLPTTRAARRPVTAWVDVLLADDADVLAERKGRSRSWILREALTEYVAKEKQAAWEHASRWPGSRDTPGEPG
jgi:hypothetical protein